MAEKRKNKIGRPQAFESAEDFLEKSGAYYQRCKEDKKIPTKGGLSIYLGVHPDTLSEYATHKGSEFSDAIKMVYLMIEEEWVQSLTRSQQVAGPIFYLKNAFHWHDKSETDITSGGKPIGQLLNELDSETKEKSE